MTDYVKVKIFLSVINCKEYNFEVCQNYSDFCEISRKPIKNCYSRNFIFFKLKKKFGYVCL